MVEGRPSEGGRCCIVEYQACTSPRDLLQPPYNARSKVHEYGGAAFTIGSDGVLVFSDFETNGILSIRKEVVDIIIDGDPATCYADFCVHPRENHIIIAVQEVRSENETRNNIVVIDSAKRRARVIISGADFYAHPRFNHDGTFISWIQWTHPDMPWNGSLLYVATWRIDEPINGNKVAGEAGIESICQPRWNETGKLFFTSDRTGYWQLYRVDVSNASPRHIRLQGFEDCDFAGSEWVLGKYVESLKILIKIEFVFGTDDHLSCTYVPLTENTLLATYTKNSINGILLIDIKSETCKTLELDLVDIQKNAIRRVSDTSFVVIGSSASVPLAVYLIDITELPRKKMLKSSITTELPPDIVSMAEHLTFPRIGGKGQNGFAHSIFVAPHNPRYCAPPSERPPLIVSLHGGPTSHVSQGLSLATQYYTSRGYAYAHVNYAGSTGYGRAYRESLNGSWGIMDACDAVSCVAYLESMSKIDPTRVGIIGASAGGYSVLRSLALYPSTWAGGISLYGISDLKALVNTMHKFERYYIQRLLFGESMSSEEQAIIYKERSPCNNSDNIAAPVLLMQGREDVVVPLCQAQIMAESIHGSGQYSKLLVFEGEGHGFRHGASLQSAIKEETAWWAKTLSTKSP